RRVLFRSRSTLRSLARNGGDRQPRSFVLRAPVARITRSDARAAHESLGDRELTHTPVAPVSLPCNEPALPTSEELPGMRDYYLQRLLPHSSLLTSRNAHD